MFFCLPLLVILPYIVMGQLNSSFEPDFAIRRIDTIVDIITLNLKKNGWSTILCMGNFPDELYIRLQYLSYPFAITNIDDEDADVEDVVQYYANTILVNLQNIKTYDHTILKLRNFPYWHPHSNIIFYYHEKEQNFLAKLYFSFWYYKAINAIIVQYDDDEEVFLISHYTPYTSDDYRLDHLYGCWTTRKIGMPISRFDDGFTCEEKCDNVTSITSKLRANNLGTCIGFSIITVPYNATERIKSLNLFEDKSKNLHGFKFRAFTTEVEPFLLITDNGNTSYTLRSRDGSIWTYISQLMNFNIDLSASATVMKKAFDFELNINQLFNFAFRKGDLYLGPIYLFDVAVVELDFSFPYRDSGVCVLSHRAGYETTLFDLKTVNTSRDTIIQFIFCFLCVWITFAIYQAVERRRINFDQIGKDFMNALRNILLITLCNPPKRRSFRLFLTISIWSFFIINFAMQASIISFLTAAKRGKDVQTFEDMIEKGYNFYGMASPDLILPDTEERFRIINSRLVSVQDLFECVKKITNDTRRFCLIDCSVGRYLVRNRLDEKGEQYLHIAKDRIHSHYLSLLHIKHSPLTDTFNKYLITFYEAGLINKWEQYRYADIKGEPPAKPLRMDDFQTLFNVYCMSLGFLFIIFMFELVIYYANKIPKYCTCKTKRVRYT